MNTNTAARALALAALGATLATALAGCGGGAQKRDDAQLKELSKQVAQLKSRVDADEKRLGSLGFGDATPLAALTQTGPANTVVAECPPGSYLFRVPRTQPVGGEALCRKLAGPSKPSQDAAVLPPQGQQ